MRKRTLGNTGIEVSEVAFGGVEIGMPYGIGINSEKDMLPEKEAIDLLSIAVDSGINFFDTARLYGRSENIMGKAFKKIRDKVIISTKCAHLKDINTGFGNKNKLKKIIENSLNDSLSALQTDYVDIFMLHNATMDVLRDDNITQILLDIKKSGKARAIGVSTYLQEETRMALDANIWDVIQLPFNLLDQRPKELFKLASEKQVGIVARSVLFKGLLSGRGKNLHSALSKVEKHIESYNQLLNKNILDLPVLATKFALSFDEISSVLIGIDKIEYLNKSVQTADGNYLKGKELSLAENLVYPDPAFLNLPYWDKMGWLK